MGTYPWWPAKLMDPARDLSFPPDADPPRPTSIPIRCAPLGIGWLFVLRWQSLAAACTLSAAQQAALSSAAHLPACPPAFLPAHSPACPPAGSLAPLSSSGSAASGS